MRTSPPFWFALVLLGAFISACGPATPYPATTAAAFSTPTATLQPPTPTLTPSPTATPIGAPPAAWAATLDTLEAQIRTIRGAPEAQVTRVVLPPDEFAARASQYTPLYPMPTPNPWVWQGLGLWDSTTPIPTPSPPDTAFFNPTSRTIFLRESDTLSPALQWGYLRAFTHALQFYSAAPPPCGSQADRCAAYAALAGGDTAYTLALWLSAYAQPDFLQALNAANAIAPTPQTEVPPALLLQQTFAEQWGLTFVFALTQRNGWQSIHQAWETPPVSTEQILSPDRYPDDQPQPVPFPSHETLSSALGEGWQVAAEGECSAWDIYLMLSAAVPHSDHLNAGTAQTATAGWDGGYWVALSHPEKGSAMLFDVHWDTAEDAVEFVKTFVLYLRGRFGPLDEMKNKALIWQAPEQGAAVLRYNTADQRTVWAFAATSAQAEALLAAVNAPGTH